MTTISKKMNLMLSLIIFLGSTIAFGGEYNEYGIGVGHSNIKGVFAFLDCGTAENYAKQDALSQLYRRCYYYQGRIVSDVEYETFNCSTGKTLAGRLCSCNARATAKCSTN